MDKGTLYSQAGSKTNVGGPELAGIADTIYNVGVKLATQKDTKDDLAQLKTDKDKLDAQNAILEKEAEEKVSDIINKKMRSDYTAMNQGWDAHDEDDTHPELKAAALTLKGNMKNTTAVFVSGAKKTAGYVNAEIVRLKSVDISVYQKLLLDGIFQRFCNYQEKYCEDYGQAVKDEVDKLGDESYADLKEAVRADLSALLSTLTTFAKHGTKEEKVIVALNSEWTKIKQGQVISATFRAKKKAAKKAAEEAKKNGSSY